MKENADVPVLPQLYMLAYAFRYILTTVFYAGIAYLGYVVIFAGKAPPEIGMFRTLLPGLFLMVCGALADPCIFGLFRVAVNPTLYFSTHPTKENESERYNPKHISMHVIVCGLIATIMLTVLPDGNILLDVVFGLAYVIACICSLLIIYYKRHMEA